MMTRDLYSIILLALAHAVVVVALAHARAVVVVAAAVVLAVAVPRVTCRLPGPELKIVHPSLPVFAVAIVP